MSKPEMLIVKWIDARSRDGFHSPDELRELKPVEIWTLAWGFEEEDRVCMAVDYYPANPERQTREGYRDIQTIPKACILGIERLEVKDERTG